MNIVTFIFFLVGTLVSKSLCYTFDISSLNGILRELEKIASEQNNTNLNDDYGLNIYQLLRKHDYPLETHWVKTEDGYVLRMQRLLGGQNKTFYGVKNKPAILVMHGLSSSSADFINTGPKKAIGLILADAGYDVWLGNNRGNTWSRNHVLLNPDTDSKFWDYSFDTCGYYDLPAKIDYIIEKTGQKKIFYIGHSQGTSQFFAMAALRPQYNDKIALMTALAPVAYMGNLSSPIFKIMVKFIDVLQFILNRLNIHELLSYSPIYGIMGKVIYNNEHLRELASIFLFLLCGFNNQGFDRDYLPLITSNAPAGISTKMIVHYGQEIISGKFRRYDYGAANLKYYKATSPPDYNISAITAPIAIYYSKNDLLAAVQDVEKLAEQLPNLVKLKLVEDKRFNHIDFIWGKNSNELIYQDLLEYQKQFIPKVENAAVALYIRNIYYTITTVLMLCLLGLQ